MSDIEKTVSSMTARQEPSARLGLVLEGGAMRGMYTAGVTDVFMENKIEFDGAIGVSAGAVFGCNYESRQIGRTIRYNTKYCCDPRYVGMRSFFRTGDLYNADFDYRQLPEELDPFDVRTFAANPMEFWCVVTDAETGKPYYHQCQTGTGEDMLYMRASASMPAASRPVRIGDRLYLDGGIADSIPLAFFQSIGYSRCVVILTQPSDYVKQPQKHFQLIKHLLRKYPAIADQLETRHTRYNEQLQYIHEQGRGGSCLLICPDSPLNIGSMCRDPQELRRVYEAGRRIGEKYLPQVREFVGEKHIGQWAHPYSTDILTKEQAGSAAI